MKKPGFRFHVIGLPHTSTDIRYTACAFTMKVLKFLKMMKEPNIDSEYESHHLIHYGNEDSDRTWCDEHVTVTSRALLEKTYGHAYLKNQFQYSVDDECYKTFYANATTEMAKRLRAGDIVLAFWGSGVRRITDNFNHLSRQFILCEPGVGYPVSNIYAPYVVYESYAYMNFCLGARKNEQGHQGITQPSWNDVVIPNYFDPSDFDFCPQRKRPYFLFIGRLNWDKGVLLYLQLCKDLGFDMVIGGQGRLEDMRHEIPSTVKFVGYCDREKRRKLMAEAQACFLCSFYVEPFGGTAVEAMMSGTPVITTDNGVFNETVIDGVTGFRVRSYEHALWACRNVHRLDPAACRQWALMNYSLQRVRLQYEEYFYTLMNRHFHPSGFYSRRDDRENLTWLQRYYPPQVLSIYDHKRHDVLYPSTEPPRPTYPALRPLAPPAHVMPVIPPVLLIPPPGQEQQNDRKEQKTEPIIHQSTPQELKELSDKLSKMMEKMELQERELKALRMEQKGPGGISGIHGQTEWIWPLTEPNGGAQWPVTVISALYDIKREELGDGRRFKEDYLPWFAETMKLNVPMVIYVDPEHESFVKQHREGLPTHLICEPFSKAPCFSKLARVAQILKSPEWKAQCRASSNLENRLPAYDVLIWSKFKWMKRAAEKNAFGSRLFVWLDAGISRFFGPTLNPRLSWPHPSWITLATNLKGSKMKKYLNNHKIWIEGHAEAAKLMNKTRIWDESAAIGGCECLLPAGCFGGTAQAIQRLESLMTPFFETELLDRGKIDNEQVGMSIMWQRHPDLFSPLIRSPHSSTWLEIVRTLSLPRQNCKALL